MARARLAAMGLGAAAIMATCGLAVRAGADVIEVAAGKGTISTAVAKAKSGDTIKLGPGEYTDHVTLVAGVTLEGPGADKATITGDDYAVIRCDGAKVQVRGVRIRGGGQTTRGVNASAPVYVADCRFEKVPEAVALMEAPLSDVVNCTFENCGIGVRAIGGASPSVLGCLFRGGDMGVFGMDGSPYIRNCVFTGVKTGAKIMGGESPVVRNCVFTGCERAGVEAANAGGGFSTGPIVRNDVFFKCGAAVRAPDNFVRRVSNCVVHEAGKPAVGPEGGKGVEIETVKDVDPGLKVADAGTVTMTGKLPDGVRLPDEPTGTKGVIGLDGVTRVGAGVAGNKAGPARFANEPFIANSVAEEYQYLKALGLRPGRQSLTKKNGRNADVHSVGGKEIAFDIERFFGEMDLKP